jgi:DNA-binding transcriptional LysR family regulator
VFSSPIRTRVELYQLRGFVTVAELGHLTKAADRLHVSQPALSAQIKALEGELGLELFERRSSGMVLTAAGERLVGEAEKLLSAAAALRNQAQSLKQEVSGVARVGTVSDPEFIRVGDLLGAAIERYPRVEVQLHHEVSGEAFAKVRDGTLDASFYYGELSHRSVGGLRLREMTYRIVAPAAWRERLADADFQSIAREPWIMTPPISTHHRLAHSLFERHSVRPTKVVEADDEVVVSSLVVAGVGLALMREDLAVARAGLDQICLWRDVRLSTTLQFIYQRHRAEDPVIRALLEILREIWNARARPRGAVQSGPGRRIARSRVAAT